MRDTLKSKGAIAPREAEQGRLRRPQRITFDSASRRRIDENGFLHVSLCHISKEQVADYYGAEIPGWQDLGLDPDRVYRGYRPGAELAKGAATFNGLPLLNEHVKDSADDPQKDLRVGNLGTDAAFRAPYLDNSLIIQDAEAIKALAPTEPGAAPKRELSASYRYDPVFEPGKYNGEPYDFIMANIRGNHVAIVEEGRAGPDVLVSDANPKRGARPLRGQFMDIKKLLEQMLAALGAGTPPEDPDAPPTGDEEETKKTDGAADNDPETDPAEDEDDFKARLVEHLNGLEDQDLAAKLVEIVETVHSAGTAADNDPDGKQAEDEEEDGEKKKDKAAMDGKARKKRGRSGTTGPVTVRFAMDANEVLAKVRKEFQQQIQAAQDVRPLIGVVDPLSFDSAPQIYQRALSLIGKPTKVTDLAALRDMCSLACDAKNSRPGYPVVAAALANDSGGKLDPAFANLNKIRKA